MLRIVFVFAFVFAFYIMYVIIFLIASVRNNLTAAIEQIFDYWFKSFNTPCANNDINNNNNNNTR